MVMRRASRIDSNQAEIVRALRAVPGVTVEVGHDDILVGYRKKTYWFEIKSREAVSARSGGIKPSSMTDSEDRRLSTYTGHYSVVWSLDQILAEIGVSRYYAPF